MQRVPLPGGCFRGQILVFVKTRGLGLVAALCLQPPSVAPQLPSVTLQPPSVTLQPPSVTLQPPSVTLQPPSVTLQPSSVTLQPPSVTLQPPSVTLQPPSVALQPPSVTPQLPSVTLQPPSVTLQPPSVTLQPPSVTLQPPSVTLQPPSVTLQPPSVALQPPSGTPSVPSVGAVQILLTTGHPSFFFSELKKTPAPPPPPHSQRHGGRDRRPAPPYLRTACLSGLGPGQGPAPSFHRERPPGHPPVVPSAPHCLAPLLLVSRALGPLSNPRRTRPYPPTATNRHQPPPRGTPVSPVLPRLLRMSRRLTDVHYSGLRFTHLLPQRLGHRPLRLSCLLHVLGRLWRAHCADTWGPDPQHPLRR